MIDKKLVTSFRSGALMSEAGQNLSEAHPTTDSHMIDRIIYYKIQWVTGRCTVFSVAELEISCTV